VKELVTEILIRAVKPLLAAILGLVIYAVLVGPLGVTGSPIVALQAWIAGALVVLLVETGFV
jgi:hypothetical protein